MSFGEILVFEKYNSVSIVDDGKIVVDIDADIKNNGNIPIIPGEIYFKLSSDDGKNSNNLEILNHTVLGRNDGKLKSRVIQADKETDIVFEVWEPILPEFSTNVKIHYEFDFEPEGILFYNFMMPMSVSTIPISKENIEYRFPKNFFVTYAPNSTHVKDDKYNVLTFEGPSAVEFEISRIPFPKSSFRLVNVFWGSIILMVILFLLYTLIKSRMTVKQK